MEKQVTIKRKWWFYIAAKCLCLWRTDVCFGGDCSHCLEFGRSVLWVQQESPLVLQLSSSWRPARSWGMCYMKVHSWFWAHIYKIILLFAVTFYEMEISVVQVGGPFVWQNMCILESVESLIKLEEDAVEKLNDHIQKLEEIAEELMSDAGSNAADVNTEKGKVLTSLIFFRNLRASKKACIVLLYEVDKIIRDQISSVIDQQLWTCRTSYISLGWKESITLHWSMEIIKFGFFIIARTNYVVAFYLKYKCKSILQPRSRSWGWINLWMLLKRWISWTENRRTL